MEHEVCDTLGNYNLFVGWDDDPCDPRQDWDNMGTMACFHRRYDFGDHDHGINSDDFNGWNQMENFIRLKLKAVVCLPIYLFDHSGQTISTEPFSCQWDSGQIGFIFATKEQIRGWCGTRRVTKKVLAQAVEILTSEVKDYDTFIKGNFYRWDVRDKDGEHMESCGSYQDEEECTQEGLDTLKGYHENAKRIRIEQQQHVIHLRSASEGSEEPDQTHPEI